MRRVERNDLTAPATQEARRRVNHGGADADHHSRRATKFMLKLKLVVLSVLAVFAVGAVASASASAAVCSESGTTFQTLCIKLVPAAPGTYPITSKIDTGTTSVLVVPALGVEILCTAAADTGNIVQHTVLSEPALITGLVIEFSGCTVDTPANCTVTIPTLTVAVVGDEEESSDTQLLFKPESGTTFATVVITGASCTAVGSFNVKGEQLCELLTPETDATEQFKLTACPLVANSRSAGTLPNLN